MSCGILLVRIIGENITRMVSKKEGKEDTVSAGANISDQKSDSAQGLSNAEAAMRLSRDGYNEILEEKTHPFLKFLKYFWGPIPGMIEVAIVLSAINHEWADFYIILALLIINVLVGFFQEYNADNAIEHLKSRLALRARVLRDGSWVQIPSRELVIDDYIRLRQGDIVPADVTLCGTGYLLLDESVLTGESLPVEKKESAIAYSGAIVKRGEMDARVSSIGMKTYFGKTATLAEKSADEGQFQKNIIKIGNYLIRVALILAVVIFLFAFFRHEDLRLTLQFILILVVASIPAGLPAILSVTLAIGALNLARKEAIVRKMTAIEEMASMDILCVDKTGTITENNITVSRVKTIGKYSERDVLCYGVLASRKEDVDPIDAAIIAKASDDQSCTKLLASYTVKSFTPYDPVSKYSQAEIIYKNKRLIVAKGAPQVILALTKKDAKIHALVEKQVEFFASSGERALGVAVKKGSHWEYAGILALYDPPRSDSAETLRAAQEMGVDVKVITGDYQAVTQNIARKVGIGDRIIAVKTLNDSSDSYIALKLANGVSEVFPEDKYTIVKVLEDHDHIVGMTGDGVNDAPALKKANIGIAVANATDAARASADLVLTRPGTTVIIDAITESRNIFQRMHNYALYRIAETLRIMLFITLSIALLGFYPISAIMIVLLVLLNDLPIITIAYDTVVAHPKPVRWEVKKMLKMATFLGIIGVISSFTFLYIGLHVLHLSKTLVQTLLFLKLAIGGHLLLFAVRTEGPFWGVAPKRSLLIATIGTQIIATIIAVYGIFIAPAGWDLALFVWLYAILLFLITDLIKVAIYKRMNQ